MGKNSKKPQCNENIEENCCIDEVGQTIQKLVRAFQLFERDQIKIYGFTTTQCYTLLEICRFETLTMNELSEKMNLNSSTMTRVLDNLVRDKYVDRDKHESDRRVVLVRLTEEGKKVADKLRDTLNEYYRKTISNIPDGQVVEVLHCADVLLKAFENANPNCC